MSWEADCKHYDECDNCEYLKEENASLKDRLKYEVEMIEGAANDEIRKLKEENARLRNEIELLKKEWVGL